MSGPWDGIARALDKASPEFLDAFYRGFTLNRQETTMKQTLSDDDYEIAPSGRRAITLRGPVLIDIDWHELGSEFFQLADSRQQAGFFEFAAYEFHRAGGGALQLAYLAQEIPVDQRERVLRFLDDLSAHIRGE